MFKNQLQELAQRNSYNLPSYACTREGPDHAPKFKSTVSFNGEIFESPGFFCTLRQAEHAAAEVALNVVTARDPSQDAEKILDESSVCKNLLQETAQRAGVPIPHYQTVRSGPGHVPVFSCTVLLAGMTFTGEPARTKKQAEKNSALAAWTALKKSAGRSAAAVGEEIDLSDDQVQVRIASNLAKMRKDRDVQSSPAIMSSSDYLHAPVLHSQGAPFRAGQEGKGKRAGVSGPVYVPRHVVPTWMGQDGRNMGAGPSGLDGGHVGGDGTYFVRGSAFMAAQLGHQSHQSLPAFGENHQRQTNQRAGCSTPIFQAPSHGLVPPRPVYNIPSHVPSEEFGEDQLTSFHSKLPIKPGMAYQPRARKNQHISTSPSGAESIPTPMYNRGPHTARGLIGSGRPFVRGPELVPSHDRDSWNTAKQQELGEAGVVHQSFSSYVGSSASLWSREDVWNGCPVASSAASSLSSLGIPSEMATGGIQPSRAVTVKCEVSISELMTGLRLDRNDDDEESAIDTSEIEAATRQVLKDLCL